MIILDPNMDTAYLWASELFWPTMIPLYIKDINRRAEFINEINFVLGDAIKESTGDGGKGVLISLNEAQKQQYINSIIEISKEYIEDIANEKIRANISLRLWSGCIKAAKSIASETLAGPNSITSRQIAFFWIDLWSSLDPIYRSGVEAAPVWKALVGQKEDIF